MNEGQARAIADAIFAALDPAVVEVRLYPPGVESAEATVRVVVYQTLAFSAPAPEPFVFTRASVAA